MAVNLSEFRAEIRADFGADMLAELEEARGLLELAAPLTPWELINRQLPAQQRRLMRVDDATASLVVSAYSDARRQISAELTHLYERYFGPGRPTPTPGQLARFVRGGDVAAALANREEVLRSMSVGALHSGVDESLRQAGVNARLQLQAMDRQYAGVANTATFSPPPGVVEEIGVARAVDSMSSLPSHAIGLVKQELITGALLGEGIVPLRNRLRPIFAGDSVRAELAARHAMLRSHNVAAELHYADVQERLNKFGRKVSKVWTTSVDDRACPVCLALHGEVVSVDQTFPADVTFSDRPPPDPWPDSNAMSSPPRHARCRCTIIPWVDGWRGGTLKTPEAMKAEARKWAEESGLATKAVTQRVPNPDAGIYGQQLSLLDDGFMPSRLVRSLSDSVYSDALSSYLICSTGAPILRGPAGAAGAAQRALRGRL